MCAKLLNHASDFRSKVDFHLLALHVQNIHSCDGGSHCATYAMRSFATHTHTLAQVRAIVQNRFTSSQLVS